MRFLEIREKTIGPDNSDVLIVLKNMAKCCREMGKKDEAESLEARAENIKANQ